MKKIFLSIFFLFIAVHSFADCMVTPGGTTGFDAILSTYATVATKWSVQLLPKVTALFWILFGTEFLYQLTFKKVLAFDLQKLYVFFVIRIFTAYMFAHIFLDITFYTGIITYFTQLGSMLGGSSITLSGGASGMAVTPSSIMNYLECQYAKPAGALALLSMSPIGGQLFGMLLFAVLTLMISIPVSLMITMIDACVVIFGGFILTGFSGSSWTQGYWQRYLSYIGGVAIRLFVTCLILGMVIQSFSVLDSMQILTLAGAFTDPKSVTTYIEAMFGLLFFNVIAMVTIPTKAAGMLSGTINGGLGEVIGDASMMMSGMRGMSGMAGVATSLGGGIMNAPGVGKTAAMGKARELLSNSANGSSTPSSSPADWKSQAKTAGSTAASQSVKDGWKDAVSTLKGRATQDGKSPGKAGGALGELGASTKQAGNLSGSHGGGAELNINPHKE